MQRGTVHTAKARQRIAEAQAMRHARRRARLDDVAAEFGTSRIVQHDDGVSFTDANGRTHFVPGITARDVDTAAATLRARRVENLS